MTALFVGHEWYSRVLSAMRGQQDIDPTKKLDLIGKGGSFKIFDRHGRIP
jgi:hypothetical protein